jgi:Nucleotidyltransferase/DNA polymerase involved in DNA repair
MERVIFHIDCNGFYASVECLDNPGLRSVPMAVAGDPESRGGIILAKNELAKAYGLQTAETIWQAKRKCPNLVLVPPRHDRYHEVSRRVKTLFEEYTDQVESFGLDEAWLDVTRSLDYFYLTAEEMAHQIRRRVKSEIGITVSIGVSFNKVFAKLGSDMKKPDAVTVISNENFKERIWPLKATELLYIGKATAEGLDRHHIRTIGDIANRDRADMVRILGKSGEMLWLFANGMEDAPVLRAGESDPIKSVGNGMTFRRDLKNENEIRTGIIALADEVATRLRRQGLKCKTVQVMIKNPMLKSISRQSVLKNPTYLQKEIVDAAMALIKNNWPMDAPIRALTVTGMNLVSLDEAQEQISLFDIGPQGAPQKRERFEKVESAMYAIREKHGTHSVAMGYVENDEIGVHQFKRNEPFIDKSGETQGELDSDKD